MITAQRVYDILTDCLFREGEPTKPRVEVQGTVKRFGFHPERLKSHRQDVIALLRELSDDFMDDGGGGMSLMQMVADKNGNLWGEQMSADHLFVLACALGLAKFTMPRRLQLALPGSMPYITILRTKFE